MKCRYCSNDLEHTFVNLINSPPSNSFLNEEDLLREEVFYPLQVYVCDSCFLVQLAEYKKSSEIFTDDYIYFSSYSKSWLAHAKEYVSMMVERFHFDKTDQVIEIASNDGYLLQYFKEKNIPVLGIDPTSNTAEVALQKGIETVEDFFSEQLATEMQKDIKAKLIIGNNVLAHVPDINDFVKGLKIILDESGIITMEFPHLLQLIKHCQFDTIYHEHFSYLSLFSVSKIFKSHGLTIFDVDEIPTHGGSLRIYAKHTDDEQHIISTNVDNLHDKEQNFGLLEIPNYLKFQQKVDDMKLDVINYLVQAKMSGLKVAAYGAAAKGNTMLNYFGIRSDLIKFVVDISPHKQGKYLPGNHIPVVDEDVLKQYQPDVIVILPWNIKSEIIKQLDYIKNWGGRFVTFVPKVEEHLT